MKQDPSTPPKTDPSLPTRRRFISTTAAATAAALALPRTRLAGADDTPSNRVRVAVMGTNGRGMAHIANFLAQPGVEVAAVCDVDSRAVKKGLEAVAKKQERPAVGATDVRRVLEDPGIDVLSIAAPNHWHAPATILACAAGKHVYVEKPGSQNAREAELIVAAARRHDRVVQLGTQRRTWPGIIEAMEQLRAGAIGPVRSARCWYNNRRGSIGRGVAGAPPSWLDFGLWQGPAPDRPYKSNLVHYNWHWHWHWGNGELGNNGVHALDLALWGLGADCPRRVTYSGGRYHHDDDQETPDTSVATYDFGPTFATWESSSCLPRGQRALPFVEFSGDGGSLAIEGHGYKVYDVQGKLVSEAAPPRNDADHMKDFLHAVRENKRPAADIAEGQKAAFLCHLGNIAYRTGHTLTLDPEKKKILGDPEAEKLWGREYRAGWEPVV